MEKILSTDKGITKATFKSFVSRNKENLYIMQIRINKDRPKYTVQELEAGKWLKPKMHFADRNNFDITGFGLSQFNGFRLIQDVDGFLGLQVRNRYGIFNIAVENKRINRTISMNGSIYSFEAFFKLIWGNWVSKSTDNKLMAKQIVRRLSNREVVDLYYYSVVNRGIRTLYTDLHRYLLDAYPRFRGVK